MEIHSFSEVPRPRFPCCGRELVGVVTSGRRFKKLLLSNHSRLQTNFTIPKFRFNTPIILISYYFFSTLPLLFTFLASITTSEASSSAHPIGVFYNVSMSMLGFAPGTSVIWGCDVDRSIFFLRGRRKTSRLKFGSFETSVKFLSILIYWACHVLWWPQLPLHVVFNHSLPSFLNATQINICIKFDRKLFQYITKIWLNSFILTMKNVHP